MEPIDDPGTWQVTVTFVEDEVTTRARAELDLGEGRRLTASGRARRNPVDPALPRVGEDLATARALSELAHRLTDASAALGEIEGRPVSAQGRVWHLPVERELMHPGG